MSDYDDDPRGSNTAALVLLGAAVVVTIGVAVYATMQTRELRAELRAALGEPAAATTTTAEQAAPAHPPRPADNGRGVLQPEVVLTPRTDE